MSLSTLGHASSSSTFKSILDPAMCQALNEYKSKTGDELIGHPLATEVLRCNSVYAIKAIFEGQAKAFQQFRNGDHKLMKWINPVVDVLYTFSNTLGGIAGIAFPPAGAIFTGISVLLAAAKDAKAGHDVLVELFERIQSFFERLGVYDQIPLTTEMVGVLVKVVTEVLCILSIATKEVKRRRAKIYFRKLLERTDIEDAFKRLDYLIQEEFRMAMAQTMAAIVVHKHDSKKANAIMSRKIDDVAENIDEIRWNQIEQDVRKWFSPTDPSTNHNTACEVYNKESPAWFFEASVYKDWMSNSSLLWIHGKPGSGKSIVCSAIIQRIMTLRDTGNATLAYFYFDFRDEEKQNLRNFVTSLLVQLSTYSKPCCDLIYRLYSAHGKGTQQPSNGILTDCLMEMLRAAVENPTFIIMDALDECPDTGMPTPREAVLNLVMDLVQLRLPNLRICVSSRPEIDIQTKLRPLAVNAISLHEESRQMVVIANYISSVVFSDEHMRKWRDEDKKLVVNELSERADGMFQWVFCQLETLRHAVQPDIRGILEALPRTLDDTYGRMLKNINEKNQQHARRLLHCLAVAVRPLRVEELAEILAFDFDGAQGGIPKFHSERRPMDQEEAVLSTCSSLISIVGGQDSRVVQFSHLSAKEFLTSDHLASLTGDLSLYHILPGPAHTILAQVCLGILLDSDGQVSPLAEYAAQHWVAHGQFGDVASHVLDGMKTLFDHDKPHFAAWIDLFDEDTESGGRLPSETRTQSPLYYSALCGFNDLVWHLASQHPQDVNAIGGSYEFPLFAALCRNHFGVAGILLKHGADINVRGEREQTALHKAIDWHYQVAIDAVQFLLEHGANVNAQQDDHWTPLHLASYNGKLEITRLLLDHGADATAESDDGETALHEVSCGEYESQEAGVRIAHLLLEHGAHVNARCDDHSTSLHFASYNGKLEIARLLLDRGADANAESDNGETALHRVSCGDYDSQEAGVRVVELLLEHGADVNAQRSDHWTPLHLASYLGKPDIARVLLNHGADVDAVDFFGKTPLHDVAKGTYDFEDAGVDVARLLLKHGAGVDVARLLLKHGADVNALTWSGESPLVAALDAASHCQRSKLVQLLLENP